MKLRALVFFLICTACEAAPSAPAEPAATAPSAEAQQTADSKAKKEPERGAAAAASAAPQAPPKADPSRLTLEGKVIQGGLLTAKVEKDTRGFKFPGHRVVVSPEGEFLIGFYRNAPKQETLTITFPDGAVLEKIFDVEQRSFKDDRIDNLPEHFVKLDAETNRKLTAANARIAAARKKYTPTPHYKSGFVWPTKGKITSRYGQKRILNGTDGGIHWGVDIAAPIGTSVKAPAAGVVIFVERDVPLAGHTLVIDHGHGLTSTLIHLNAFTKKVGDEVKQGDAVATVGMTGRTNGAHLDWRMNLFETYRLDPELLVPPM